jgi:hypothetical protein
MTNCQGRRLRNPFPGPSLLPADVLGRTQDVTPKEWRHTSTTPESSRSRPSQGTTKDTVASGMESSGCHAWRMRAARCVARSVAPWAFAGFRFPPEVITSAVRWYLRFGLS